MSTTHSVANLVHSLDEKVLVLFDDGFIHAQVLGQLLPQLLQGQRPVFVCDDTFERIIAGIGST